MANLTFDPTSFVPLAASHPVNQQLASAAQGTTQPTQQAQPNQQVQPAVSHEKLAKFVMADPEMKNLPTSQKVEQTGQIMQFFESHPRFAAALHSVVDNFSALGEREYQFGHGLLVEGVGGIAQGMYGMATHPIQAGNALSDQYDKLWDTVADVAHGRGEASVAGNTLKVAEQIPIAGQIVQKAESGGTEPFNPQAMNAAGQATSFLGMPEGIKQGDAVADATVASAKELYNYYKNLPEPQQHVYTPLQLDQPYTPFEQQQNWLRHTAGMVEEKIPKTPFDASKDIHYDPAADIAPPTKVVAIPEMAEQFRQTYLNYAKAMKEGNWGVAAKLDEEAMKLKQQIIAAQKEQGKFVKADDATKAANKKGNTVYAGANPDEIVHEGKPAPQYSAGKPEMERPVVDTSKPNDYYSAEPPQNVTTPNPGLNPDHVSGGVYGSGDMELENGSRQAAAPASGDYSGDGLEGLTRGAESTRLPWRGTGVPVEDLDVQEERMRRLENLRVTEPEGEFKPGVGPGAKLNNGVDRTWSPHDPHTSTDQKPAPHLPPEDYRDEAQREYARRYKGEGPYQKPLPIPPPNPFRMPEQPMPTEAEIKAWREAHSQENPRLEPVKVKSVEESDKLDKASGVKATEVQKASDREAQAKQVKILQDALAELKNKAGNVRQMPEPKDENGLDRGRSGFAKEIDAKDKKTSLQQQQVTPRQRGPQLVKIDNTIEQMQEALNALKNKAGKDDK